MTKNIDNIRVINALGANFLSRKSRLLGNYLPKFSWGIFKFIIHSNSNERILPSGSGI